MTRTPCHPRRNSEARVNRRSRSACLTGALLTVLLTAGPALAYDPNGPQEMVRPNEPGLSPLETILLFVLVCLFPEYFPGLAYGFGLLCWLTTLGRVATAFRVFAETESRGR